MQREGADPGGQEAADGPRSGDVPQQRRQPGHRQRGHVGDEAQAHQAGGQVDGGEQQEPAPPEVVIGERARGRSPRRTRPGWRPRRRRWPWPGSGRSARSRRRWPPARWGRRRPRRPPPAAGPRRSAGGAPRPRPAARRARPISGPADHEELAAEPVGVARHEGGEDHLGERLGRADQPDGGAVRVAVSQVGEVELDGHGRPRRRPPGSGRCRSAARGSTPARVSRSPCSSSATRSGAAAASPGWGTSPG